MQDVIRRKVQRAALAQAEGGPGADRCWRLALARAARDTMGLGLEVRQLTLMRHSQAEVLDLPPDLAFLAMLEGPAEGLGLLALSPSVLASMIEVQTMGRVSPQPVAPRKPTRTDAAMVAGMIDVALAGLEDALAEEADLIWAGGFRYASFLEDARPLGLLLEDHPYRVLTAEVVLAGGVRTGQVMLALPADGRGRRPDARPGALDHAAIAGPVFSAALSEAVMGADAALQAVICRVQLPLQAVMGLAVGDLLPLGQSTLDRITLEGGDGRAVGQGRLGQSRGLRALRLTDAPEMSHPRPIAPHLATGTG
ncbi:MAG: FliM/FliN family flagellar motor switch protein [Pseudomonadota bacterium]